MEDKKIIIIGAGASGLMAAKELAKAGKQVTILEARDRIGGRIYTLETNAMGYMAEAGAEFIHGDLPLTKSLIKEAGLTLIPTDGKLYTKRDGNFLQEKEFIPHWNEVLKRLNEVEEDIPIAKFLNDNYPVESYPELHRSINTFVEGYDAADPNRASTIALREEWIGENKATQYRIKEGYGALINFLKSECEKYNVELILNSVVTTLTIEQQKAVIQCANFKKYDASKIILTTPLPVLKNINFNPPIPKKLKAASKIGFGVVIKFLLRFNDRWWLTTQKEDLENAGFIFSDEFIPTWWTQHPNPYPVLTGWLAGPKAENFIHYSSVELLEAALTSLTNIFKINKEEIKNKLINYKIINWGADPYTLCAYAYATPETTTAKAELLKSIENIMFLSGEALYKGTEMGTVEAALASGKNTSTQILNE